MFQKGDTRKGHSLLGNFCLKLAHIFLFDGVWVRVVTGVGTYLGDRIFARPVDDVVQGPFPADVVDAHKLEQGRVDEAHADAVPHVHRRQVRNHRQCAAETVRGGEKIQHGCDAWGFVVSRRGSCGKREKRKVCVRDINLVKYYTTWVLDAFKACSFFQFLAWFCECYVFCYNVICQKDDYSFCSWIWATAFDLKVIWIVYLIKYYLHAYFISK